ncbi:MAG: ATP-dependent 6-phosphofructokinase [Opitutales bacterium]|nr:ATP-dependent 6-phosphofructokinase [Opitutales bacterium]
MQSCLQPSFDPSKVSFEVPRIAEATIPVRSLFPDDPIWEHVDSSLSLPVPFDPLNPVPGQAFTQAVPPQKLMADPRNMRVAVVTCGGLCPGLNDVIRGITLVSIYHFHVKEVLGIRCGYPGLEKGQFVTLTADMVDGVQNMGGTILGSARGIGDLDTMIDNLVAKQIDILFCVGGDGTLRGASALSARMRERGLKISVVGVPKTIDNDIPFVSRSFGFTTAVEEAREILRCAHVESKGNPNGIGLVRLMGRSAGFVCASATLASGDVNFCLVQEADFDLKAFLVSLEKRMDKRGHAVIALAEGLASKVMEPSGFDPSGNPKYGDVGPNLKARIEEHFKSVSKQVSVKYFDPSYSVRSVPANSEDSIFCWNLSRQAVYGAMAGYTEFCVGHWHGYFTFVPIKMMHGLRKSMALNSELWLSVLSITGQPPSFTPAQDAPKAQ